MQIKNNKILIDTSALIALLKKEVGYEIIDKVIAYSAISSVNLCEFVSILSKNDIPTNEIDEIISDIVPTILPCNNEIGVIAGKLSKFTTQYGLSLGDRICIATGQYYKMEIYTADRIWSELDIPDVKIKLIR